VPRGPKPGLYNDVMVRPDAPADFAVRSALLDNGLKVLVRELHTAPLASVWCWYRVGSGDEVSGLTGISHWVEHMNFKGTRNIPRDQVKGIIERFGGAWNGYTWIDQTTYLETASRDALDQMLFIEAERMANSLFDPEDCESERTVIISELEGGENDPEQLLDIEVTAAAFKAHPYGHPTIGWLGDLRRMTRDELYGHYRRHYVPNNATLVVVGDVEADDVLRRVERQFGAIAAGEAAPQIRTAEPAQLGARHVTVAKEGTIGYVKIAVHAPAADDPDFFRLLVLDAVLAGAKGVNLWTSFRGAPPQRSARLYRALVECRLASSVSGALLPTRDPFLYMISVTASEGTPLATLEQAASAELDRVVSDGITGQELARAKNQLRARLVFETDSVTNIAHQLGFFETVASVDYFRTLWGRLEKVTVDEVGEAARRYLRPGNRTVGWFQPLPAGSGDRVLERSGDGAGSRPEAR
jgi:zinc protease